MEVCRVDKRSMIGFKAYAVESIMPWTWVGPDGHEGIILAHKEINFASEKSTTVADNVEEQIIPVPPSAPLMANSTDELGEVVKKRGRQACEKRKTRPAKKNIFWAMGCIKKYHRGVDIISYGDLYKFA